ncbi:MAG: DUF3237 family protein [Anaerolineae bacterium]|jgi:hypothetical protein
MTTQVKQHSTEPLDLSASELVYEAEIHFTGMVDYGVSMEALSSGKMAIPSAGARFDQTFEGMLHGPKLSGKISGTDYLYVRADGLFQLHLHARVTTEDGANISLSSEGVSIQTEGEKVAQLRSAVSLFTSSESYSWLNYLRLWAVGTFDPMKGEALIRAYAT